jgi:hypothetical protein
VGGDPGPIRPPPRTPRRVSLRTEYHELVDVDLLNDWTWYEDHEHGLGDRFLDAIAASVERASQLPNVGTPVLRDGTGEIIERKSQPTASRTRFAMGSSVIVSSSWRCCTKGGTRTLATTVDREALARWPTARCRWPSAASGTSARPPRQQPAGLADRTRRRCSNRTSLDWHRASTSSSDAA